MGQDLKADFEYIQWRDIYQHEKPFEIFIDLPPELKDTQRTNLIFQPVAKQIIHDARGREADFSLDTHGFTWEKHRSNLKDFTDPGRIVDTYLPEMEEFIKCQIHGADRVFIFDWRVSRVYVVLGHRLISERPERARTRTNFLTEQLILIARWTLYIHLAILTWVSL